MLATTRFFAALATLAVASGSVSACGGTSSDAGVKCTYAGRTYDRGERFPADDGCNTCSCEADGRAACSLLACESCDGVLTRYSTAIDEAKACDPEQADQCSKLITEGLACGCESFVNDEQAEAIASAAAAQEQYSTMSCGGGVVCGPCRAPSGAYCSAEGRCEPLFDDGDAACKVGGVVYKSGTNDIADPVSCNKCQCQDGQLACTEIGCSLPCPADTAFSSQCAQCGPTDACLVVEHACLPTCSDTCEQGSCIDGICKTVCG